MTAFRCNWVDLRNKCSLGTKMLGRNNGVFVITKFVITELHCVLLFPFFFCLKILFPRNFQLESFGEQNIYWQTEVSSSYDQRRLFWTILFQKKKFVFFTRKVLSRIDNNQYMEYVKYCRQSLRLSISIRTHKNKKVCQNFWTKCRALHILKQIFFIWFQI